MGVAKSGRWHESTETELTQVDVYVGKTLGTGKVLFHAWLTPRLFDHLKTQSGDRLLRHWLADMMFDPNELDGRDPLAQESAQLSEPLPLQDVVGMERTASSIRRSLRS